MMGKPMSQSRKQHPYTRFEGSVLWRTVEKEIMALVKNGDLKERKRFDPLNPNCYFNNVNRNLNLNLLLNALLCRAAVGF